MEYVCSISDDSSIEEAEKLELIFEYLSASFEVTGDMQSIAAQFLRLRHEEDLRKEAQADLSQLTAKAVADCLAVIRTNSPSPPQNDQGSERSSLTKDLLRRYDGDQPLEEEEEIHGLRPNENRLRIIRDREEARTRAKKEQEQAHAMRVDQKLKSQGERLKTTVRRK